MSTFQSARQLALAAYLAAFDRYLHTPTTENGQALDDARGAWALEIALDEAQQRLAV